MEKVPIKIRGWQSYLFSSKKVAADNGERIKSSRKFPHAKGGKQFRVVSINLESFLREWFRV